MKSFQKKQMAQTRETSIIVQGDIEQRKVS